MIYNPLGLLNKYYHAYDEVREWDYALERCADDINYDID
jgi:hypothetical protein